MLVLQNLYYNDQGQRRGIVIVNDRAVRMQALVRALPARTVMVPASISMVHTQTGRAGGGCGQVRRREERRMSREVIQAGRHV